MDKRLYDAFASLSQTELDSFLPADFEPDIDIVNTEQIRRRTLQKAGLMPAGKEAYMKETAHEKTPENLACCRRSCHVDRVFGCGRRQAFAAETND